MSNFNMQVKQEDGVRILRRRIDRPLKFSPLPLPQDTALFITRSFVSGGTDNIRYEFMGDEQSPVLTLEHYIEQVGC